MSAYKQAGAISSCTRMMMTGWRRTVFVIKSKRCCKKRRRCAVSNACCFTILAPIACGYTFIQSVSDFGLLVGRYSTHVLSGAAFPFLTCKLLRTPILFCGNHLDSKLFYQITIFTSPLFIPATPAGRILPAPTGLPGQVRCGR